MIVFLFFYCPAPLVYICDRDWLVDNDIYQECKVVELFKIGKTHICEGKLISGSGSIGTVKVSSRLPCFQ